MDNQLRQGERAVLSSFRSREEADSAVKKLLALGIDHGSMSVTEVAPQPEAPRTHLLNPITGDIPSLASLVSEEQIHSRDASILQAATPIQSGMADGRDMVDGFNWCLTVVAPESLVERVVKVVKDGGGFT
ncbi:MAG: hypothetical protein OWT28_09185 [Firmicutes bacterium]|nr:hypothetical protein [Bacillota bacterium]